MQQHPQPQSIMSQLADTLQQHKTEIIDEWVKATLAETAITASDGLTHRQLVDHVPEMYEEICRILKEQPDHYRLRDARTHGSFRLKEGYKLDEVLEELDILKAILLEYTIRFLREHPDTNNEIETEVRKRIHRYLREASVASAQQYAKEQEITSQHYQKRIEQILYSIGEGIYGLDRHGKVIFINQLTTELLGWSAEELTGQLIHNFVHHSRADGTPYPWVECPIYATFHDGTVHRTGDEVFWRKDGSSLSVEYTSTPILEDGAVIGAVVAFQDITERKRAEEQIKKQRRLLELANIMVRDLKNRIILWNKGAEQLYGWPASEALGQFSHSLLQTVFPQPFTEIEEQLWRTGAWSGELVHTRRDGSQVIVASNWILYRDEQTNQPISILEVNNDITAQKNTEQAMRDAEERLRLATEAADIGTWDYNIITDELDWSDRVKEIFGLPPTAQITFELYTSRIHPEDRERRQQDARNALDPNGSGIYKTEIRTVPLADGLSHWVAIAGKAFFNKEGRAVRLIGTARDITERKQAEIEIARAAAIVEFSDDAIFSKTLAGIITSWNRGAEKIFGYQADEILGQHISILLPPERVEEENDILAKLRQGEVIEHYETERMTKDGRIISISMSTATIKDSEGQIIGAANISRDISESSRLKQELEQRNQELEKLNRSRQQLMRTISHELGNLLNAIYYPIGLLQRDISDEQRTKMFEILKRNLVDIRTLLDQLTDYSTIIAGQESLKLDFIDIKQVAMEITEVFRVAAEAKQLKLLVDIEPGVSGLISDQLKVRRIIHNLVSNAIKYSQQGVVHVSVKHEDHNHYRITVTDQGSGISVENLKQLFQEFQRFNANPAISGTGLGLAITKRLVEQLQGEIQVTSTLGKGSRFEVILPKILEK